MMDEEQKEFIKDCVAFMEGRFGKAGQVIKPTMPCVPGSIGISKGEGISILNLNEQTQSDRFQGLFKQGIYPSFSVDYFKDTNTGDNMTYKEVEKPEPGKLYYVADVKDMRDVGKRRSYKIYLSNQEYVQWENEGDVSHESYEWERYYEIIPVGE